MKSPHILLAASNVAKLRANIAHLVDVGNLKAIDDEITANVIGLFRLGEQHFNFARQLQNTEWRQKISRLYYGAYNAQRAVRLCESGSYSTDSSDHKNIGGLPARFPNLSTYVVQLPLLRDDRNLCDYDHTAETSDLAIPLSDAFLLVQTFIADATSYLQSRGVNL